MSDNMYINIRAERGGHLTSFHTDRMVNWPKHFMGSAQENPNSIRMELNMTPERRKL